MKPISLKHYQAINSSFLTKLALISQLILLIMLAGCSSETADTSIYSIKNEKWYQDTHLLNQAWQQPTASLYRNNFTYQDNTAFCGPASIVNVLDSIGISNIEQSEVFDDTAIYYIKARIMGLTLDEMASLLDANLKKFDRNEWAVTLLRDLTLEQFRKHLADSNNNNQRYIINFNRFELFGIDIGHHSPLGGFNAKEDLVFVLDVYDKYKPFQVKADLLYKAMNTIDSETGKKRGLVSIKRITQH